MVHQRPEVVVQAQHDQAQALSLISMLAAATASQTQTAAQPVNAGGGTADGASADKRLPRGSIVNILA